MVTPWIPIATKSGDINPQKKRLHTEKIATAGKYLLTASASHSVQAHCRRDTVRPIALAYGLLKVSNAVTGLTAAQCTRGGGGVTDTGGPQRVVGTIGGCSFGGWVKGEGGDERVIPIRNLAGSLGNARPVWPPSGPGNSRLGGGVRIPFGGPASRRSWRSGDAGPVQSSLVSSPLSVQPSSAPSPLSSDCSHSKPNASLAVIRCSGG